MLAPQDVSIYLNNALKPSHFQAELDCEAPLPESIRDMPEQVTGHLIGLDLTTLQDLQAAWKRVMIMNATHVLYSFTFDPAGNNFMARKR